MSETAIVQPTASEASAERATPYRMVMPNHVCPFGPNALHLLCGNGYGIDDHWLETRDETHAFEAERGVKTPPQTFVGDGRIGGYDDVRRSLGKTVRDPDATGYRPVITIFAMTAPMALTASMVVPGSPFTVRSAMWFVSLGTYVLAILKLQDLETFSHAPGL